MIRSFHYAGDGVCRRDLPLPDLREAMKSGKGLLWVDLEAPTDDEVKVLGPDLFDFHPLAIEDCIHAQSRPKVDDYEEYLYLVFHAWRREEREVRLEEVDFFLGGNYLVSHHAEPRSSVTGVIELVARDPRLVLGAGADMLLHNIIDRMVDRYTVVVDDIDQRVDGIETAVLEHPTDAALREILVLKRDLQELFRTIRHQRDVVNSLAREGHPVISKKGRQFFRDAYDHVVRIHDTVEGLRDEVAGARDAYLAVVSNRMNAVMKNLSLIATVILPLTLLTGIYGMNINHMPFQDDPHGFAILCGLMAVVGTVTYFAFRRRGWV